MTELKGLGKGSFRRMKRTSLILAGFFILLAGVVVARLLVEGPLRGGEMLNEDAIRSILSIRASRAACGVIVGAALAVAGVMLQSLLRNPLASPDLLGLGSGAGLGVMLSILVAFQAGQQTLGLGFQTPAALVGSLAAMSLVYALSQRRGLLDPISLVLVGVTIAMICAAGIDLVRHMLPLSYSEAASRMLMGAIHDDVSLRALMVIGALVGVAIALGVAAGRSMDAAALGDDEARSVGVPLGALRAMLFVLSGVLTACAIALAGPIGFIGLVAPHVARLCIGPSHRALIVAAAACGGTLVVGADCLVRLLDLGTGRLPISILTSILGGPVFILLLRARHRGEV